MFSSASPSEMKAPLVPQCDSSECHTHRSHQCLFSTSVAEVLEKHGLQKPISYVRNSQNSEEEAHGLMVKLCRHTGRR